MTKLLTRNEVFVCPVESSFEQCKQQVSKTQYQFFLYKGLVYLTLKPIRPVCKEYQLR